MRMILPIFQLDIINSMIFFLRKLLCRCCRRNAPAVTVVRELHVETAVLLSRSSLLMQPLIEQGDASVTTGTITEDDVPVSEIDDCWSGKFYNLQFSICWSRKKFQISISSFNFRCSNRSRLDTILEEEASHSKDRPFLLVHLSCLTIFVLVLLL